MVREEIGVAGGTAALIAVLIMIIILAVLALVVVNALTLSKEQLVFGLVVYGFVASILPVWMLLTPRDYLSTFMKIGVIVLLAVGLLIATPTLQNQVGRLPRPLPSRVHRADVAPGLRATPDRSPGELDAVPLLLSGTALAQGWTSSSGATAGPASTLPSTPKREPWQGQSHDFSASLKRTVHPRWVQRADTACSAPAVSR